MKQVILTNQFWTGVGKLVYVRVKLNGSYCSTQKKMEGRK